MMSVVPAAGDFYDNPTVPVDFAGMGVTPGIHYMLCCHNGPDRYLYWVYDDMKSTDTAITTVVPRGTCFETRESIAASQLNTVLTDPCSTCRRQLGDHMTAAQATTAFTAHAAQIPCNTCAYSHTTCSWCCSSSWYGHWSWYYLHQLLLLVLLLLLLHLLSQPTLHPHKPNREDYKLLITMASHRDKWSP